MCDQKMCHACGIAKPVSAFSLCTGRKDGLQTQCKECKKAYRSTESGREATARYEGKVSRKVSKKERMKQWYAANREAQRVRCREYYESNKESGAWRESNRRSYVVNKHTYRARDMRRKAASISATPPWLTHEHLMEMRRMYRVAQDVTARTGVRHEVDHIVPLMGHEARGLHVPWNLRVIPMKENRSKGNKIHDRVVLK